MKKILLICGLAAFLLAGCTKSQIVNPTAATGEEAEMPSYDFGSIGDELNKTYTKNDQYPGVEIAFQIIGGSSEASFGLTVKEGTTSEEAVAYAETVLKAFNDLFTEQESTIAKSGDNYYGGFYDEYVTALKVTPEGKKDDPSAWLIDLPAIDPAEKILSVEAQNAVIESERAEMDAEVMKDEDQDVEHGPGTVPTEAATFESKPE